MHKFLVYHVTQFTHTDWMFGFAQNISIQYACVQVQGPKLKSY